MMGARSWTGLSAAVLAAGGLVFSVSVPGAAAKTPTTTTLSGSAASAQVLTHRNGPVAKGSVVRFEMVLALRHAAAARTLVRQVSSTGSKSYRHFVTAGVWEQRFSPTAAEVHATTAWLRKEGFHVRAVSKDRVTVSAVGTAGQVERAFDTTLGMYTVRGHRVRLASRDLSIPSSLSGVVSGVMGVNQHPAVAAAAVPPPAAFITYPVCSAYYGQKYNTEYPPFGDGFPRVVPGTVCGYKPGQLRSAYGVSSAETGKGVTVAVVDAYASSTQPADAERYFAANDPAHPLRSGQFRQLVGQPFDDQALCDASDWQSEQAIDVEAVHAMAPGANILYSGGSDCEDGLFTALQKVIDNDLADVVTNSYGDPSGDLLDDESYRTAYDDEFMLAATTGISVLFSSGDDGDDFDLTGISAPSYPASSPYVTAVGGTTLAVNKRGQRTAEYGWSTGRSTLCTANIEGLQPGCDPATRGTWLPAGLDGASGGGTSYNYNQPYYQNGIVPTALSERNSPIYGAVPTRVVPDISMDADPATGFLIGLTEQFPNGTVKYGQTRYGGTSLASPLLAGVIADAAQTAGTPLGFINPAIYQLDRTSPGVIEDVTPAGKKAQIRVDYASQAFGAGLGTVDTFRQITWEGTVVYCDGSGNCASRPNTLTTAAGYDGLTGLGSINATFITALAK